MTEPAAAIADRRLQWQQLTPDQRRARVHRAVADCIEIARWRRDRMERQLRPRRTTNDFLFGG